MRRQLLRAVCVLALVHGGVAVADCFTVYDRAGQVVYESVAHPVDLSRPLHETVPSVFGQGATLVFTSGVSTVCGNSAGAGTSGYGSPTTGGRETFSASSLDASAQPLVRHVDGDYLGAGSLNSGGSAGSDHLWQTGPRGGQFYINGNGNKTYSSAGRSGGGGRR